MNLLNLKQTFGVSLKTFCRKWEGETHPKWSFILKQLEKWQSEHYPYNLDLTGFCRRTSFSLLHICFLYLLIFVNEETFFSRVREVGIKVIFHNIWRTFRLEKIKHDNNYFEIGLCYMQINNTYIKQTKELQM